MVRLWIALIVGLATLATGVVNVVRVARNKVEPAPYPALHLASLLLAFVLAMLPLEAVSPLFKGLMGFALLLLIVREAFAWAPGTPRAAGAGAGFFIWFVLWIVLAATVGGGLWSLPGLLVLLPLVLLALPAWRLRARAGALWLTLLLYGVQMALALGFALVLVVLQPALWSALALAGVLALATADLLLALDTIGLRVRALSVWEQALVSLAALLLALAIWGPSLIRFPSIFGM